jgi:hypothetical protein
MKPTRTETFKRMNDLVELAKIAAILFWMPILVLVFLGLFIHN